MRLFFFYILLSILCGCSFKFHHDLSTIKESTTSPDYSNIHLWAAHPWINDPSDSVPLSLNYQGKDSLADVFFIHPTTYTGKRYGWNANMNDSILNKRTDKTTILYQASVFNQHCRIFAPRYRQAHLSAFFTNDSDAKKAFDIAYSDIKAAFIYYLKNYNCNRPFIIAGHSQGAMLGERLLKEFFDTGELKTRLIAAYIVGWPIPKNYFDHLKVCESDSETRCFCGWRTFQRGYIPNYVRSESIISYVTNPLSWKTDTEYVDRNENSGSVLTNFNKVIPRTTDAQIHEGVLWVSRPKFPGSLFFRTRNYHIGDINLFYVSIRSNVEKRILTYKAH